MTWKQGHNLCYKTANEKQIIILNRAMVDLAPNYIIASTPKFISDKSIEEILDFKTENSHLKKNKLKEAIKLRLERQNSKNNLIGDENGK
jgi:hypothetical protein